MSCVASTSGLGHSGPGQVHAQRPGRYWYSMWASLNRIAAGRARQFEEARVLMEIDKALISYINGLGDRGHFDAVQVAPGSSSNVTDEPGGFRAVGLGGAHPHTRRDGSEALVEAKNILMQRGSTPRVYRNMLVFLCRSRDFWRRQRPGRDRQRIGHHQAGCGRSASAETISGTSRRKRYVQSRSGWASAGSRRRNGTNRTPCGKEPDALRRNGDDLARSTGSRDPADCRGDRRAVDDVARQRGIPEAGDRHRDPKRPRSLQGADTPGECDHAGISTGL